jgi:hypothetical protein
VAAGPELQIVGMAKQGIDTYWERFLMIVLALILGLLAARAVRETLLKMNQASTAPCASPQPLSCRMGGS